MKPIKYFEILMQALKITWDNKFLWFFGFLVLLGSIFSGLNWEVNPESKQTELLIDFIQKKPGIFLIIALVIIGVMIAFFVLKLMGTIALIKSANNILVYRQASIKSISIESKEHIWKLVLLEIIIGLAIGIIAVILVAPVFYLYTAKAMVFFVISAAIALVIFVGLIFTAYFLRRYAYLFIILGNAKIKLGLELAYSLFRKNIKEGILMVCALFIANIVAFGLFFIFILSLFAILLIPGALAYLVFSKTGVIIVAIIGAVFLSVFLLAFFSGYVVFAQTAWVLFFQELSLEKKSKKSSAEEIKSTEKIPVSEVV